VIVDWSAQATPKRGPDSIWSYTLGDGDAVNHRTRSDTSSALVELLRLPGRTLVGFDFPLGYPAGLAARAQFESVGGVPWSATWEHLAANITDDDRNRNNRWAVAADLNRRLGELRFWGVPSPRASPHLTVRKPSGLSEFRIVERRLKQQGRHPFSVWQLLGAGSVGSQALTGIPVVHRLRHHPDLRMRARVWPFETGFTTDPTAHHADAIVIAEVWPSAISFDHIDHRTPPPPPPNFGAGRPWTDFAATKLRGLQGLRHVA
jgi:precorrin-8X/cobalt-precorrin-8 methylmutase